MLNVNKPLQNAAQQMLPWIYNKTVVHFNGSAHIP